MELEYIGKLSVDPVTKAYRLGSALEAQGLKCVVSSRVHTAGIPLTRSRSEAAAHFDLALKSAWTGWPQMPQSDDVVSSQDESAHTRTGASVL